MHVLSSVYGAAATWRRRWYSRDPARVRRLARPVISVGNLRVGGSGKTPVVAHLARLLIERGERPSILTRGYARTSPRAGITLVSDGTRVREDVGGAGDEPLMLARSLPGVPVLVGSDRFAAGLLAERQHHVSVHLLDDGFQHLRLARNVDLLLVDEDDLSDRVLPAGRLREPLENAAAADAALVTTATWAQAAAVARTLRINAAFSVHRQMLPPRMWSGHPLPEDRPRRALAFAGIARPERFFTALPSCGWDITATRAFRDHHPYTHGDLERLSGQARAAAVSWLVTTEKDAVRIPEQDVRALSQRGVNIAIVPLSIDIEPAGEFIAWLLERLR